MSWAVVKMGTTRPDYVKKAYSNFVAICTLLSTLTGRDPMEVARSLRFEFPLYLQKKRAGFTDLLVNPSFNVFMIAAEYEELINKVTTIKSKAKTAAQFRLWLDEILEPLPGYPEKLKKIISNYHLRIQPSDVVCQYLGYRYRVSGPQIKKLAGLARRPEKLLALLEKHLIDTYRPKNIDAILKTLA